MRRFGDDSITDYVWDSGDGREKIGPVVSHLYRLPGDYYVRLVAINDFSSTEVGRWVHVDPVQRRCTCRPCSLGRPRLIPALP
ncbi:MAG: PKD domain-containing protein [Chloroflexota bacterium]